MKKILLLYYNRNEKCVTGGQAYENFMYESINEYDGYLVERFNIKANNSVVAKLLAPLVNLKYIGLCLKYDLIITNSVYGWYFTLLCLSLKIIFHKRVAIIHHHFVHLEFVGIKKKIYKLLENTFLRSSSLIVTVSPYIYELCTSKFGSQYVRYWPIPFDNHKVGQTDVRCHDELLYMGTIEPRKGLIYMIESLKILKRDNIRYHLSIVGKIKDQQYFEKLKKEIDSNGLNVNFLGFVTDVQKDNILKKSSVFVFPSLLEGFGMVLCEVMRYGIPVVCFDNSAMPYTVKNDYNGYVVDNKNPHEMAKAVESILLNEEIRYRLMQGCYESIEKVIGYAQYKKLLLSELNDLT